MSPWAMYDLVSSLLRIIQAGVEVFRGLNHRGVICTKHAMCGRCAGDGHGRAKCSTVKRCVTSGPTMRIAHSLLEVKT